MLLLKWFEPITWSTDQVGNIINFFSAAGTVGALLYAFYLERKNGRKINDLANIVLELQKQNALQARQIQARVSPEIALLNTEWVTLKNGIELTLANSGGLVEVTGVTDLGSQLEIGELTFPFQFTRLHNWYIRLHNWDRQVALINATYHFVFSMKDILGHTYKLAIKGIGPAVSIQLEGAEVQVPRQ